MALFVTSFNEAIYRASAKQMLEMWSRRAADGDEMICFCEGDWRRYTAGVGLPANAAAEAIEDDPWFGSWMRANKHNIPERYGGDGEDQPSVWNSKASLWFRKAAAWTRAYEMASPGRVVVWLDTDILITQDLEAGLFDRALGDHDIGYLCSALRKKKTGVETGVFALRKNERSDEFVADYKAAFDRSAGEWGLIERWDDGFVFKWVLRNTTVPPQSFMKSSHRLSGGASCVDWALQDSCNPLSASPLRNHLVHQKGLHRGVGADGLGRDDNAHTSRTARYLAVRQDLRASAGARRRPAPRRPRTP